MSRSAKPLIGAVLATAAMVVATVGAGASFHWVIRTAPDTSSSLTNSLRGIACSAPGECWAVGYAAGSSQTQTLIERHNASPWRLVSSPDTATNQLNLLNSVACASTTLCFAVGFADSGTAGVAQTLIERWDGTSWTIVTSPDTSTSNFNVLNGVACVSKTLCWATGEASNGSVAQTLFERWDGTSWSIVGSPDTSTGEDNILNSISCTSATRCWAVGQAISAVSQNVIERWDGTSWTLSTSPDTSSSFDNALNGVRCVSKTQCWAVGASDNTGPNQTLILSYNGSAWTIVSSPDTSSTLDNDLRAVTCYSTSECWAAGDANNGSVSQALVMQGT